MKRFLNPERLFLTAPSVKFAVILVLGAMLSNCSGDEPRPSGVKPCLTFSPTTIESCATTVVTLECTARGDRSLGARIASPESDSRDESEGATDTKIASIQIFKMSGKSGTGEEEWEVFAELGVSQSPSGPAVADQGVEVSGNVGGSSEESYLRVIWDQASDETFGVYRCDVTPEGYPQGAGTVNSEPVTLENPNSKGNKQDEVLNLLRNLQAERQRDMEWRSAVDENLAMILKGVGVLDMFARGNAFKLSRIIRELGNITSPNTRSWQRTTPTSRTRRTTTRATTPRATSTTPTATTSRTTTRSRSRTTTKATRRTYAPPTGKVDFTKKFILVGIAGEKPTGTLPPDTTISAAAAAANRESKRNRRRLREERRNRNRDRRVGRSV